MKIPALFLTLISCNIASAQQKEAVGYIERLDAAIASSDHDHRNYKYLDTFINKFQRAGKLDSIIISKDAVGIAIFLSDNDKSLEIYPARCTYEKGNANISALRSRNTQKPSADMLAYVNTYLNDWKNLDQTNTFKSLMLNRPIANSKLTPMTNGHLVDSGYDTSFIRGDEHWLYAISFGDSGIIVYAFKLS